MGDCVQHDRWRDAPAGTGVRREQGICVFLSQTVTRWNPSAVVLLIIEKSGVHN